MLCVPALQLVSKDKVAGEGLYEKKLSMRCAKAGTLTGRRRLGGTRSSLGSSHHMSSGHRAAEIAQITRGAQSQGQTKSQHISVPSGAQQLLESGAIPADHNFMVQLTHFLRMLDCKEKASMHPCRAGLERD